MRKFAKFGIVLIAVLFVSTAFTYKQTQPEKSVLKWYDWNEGYPKAIKEGKIVLVDAYTDWCGWCKRMDRDTYSNQEVIEKINKHFIPIKFNPEIKGVRYNLSDTTFSPEELYYLLTNGNSTGFPTTYFIFPKKMSLFYEPGYKDATSFLAILNGAVAESEK
ncbi:MAG: DUF255 domain-containing protein [Bacteroidia bacterium]|nr:DUF255 domain-containing protein [Bacteroidia bacterium]